jgi:mannose-6-phosphate isomerase-like protein (cupin superfamily)
MLQDFADAWRGREEYVLDRPFRIGLWVRTGKTSEAFVVTLTNESQAEIQALEPADFDFGFELDIETLELIHRAEINAMTAMAQASGDDPIPLMPRFPPGFEWTTANRGYLIPLFFHFWNRNWPETVAFGEEHARQVHGGLATIFFYDSGVRSAWYRVEPGMHINENPEDQANPFHTFVIVTKGMLQSRLDGNHIVLRSGQGVFIPAGMAHEFWSDEAPGEFVILMFGEGA